MRASKIIMIQPNLFPTFLQLLSVVMLMLLSLLIIPLNVPVLIFGTTAVSEAVVGGNATSWLALMGALALGSLAVMPVAIGAALRVSLDQ